MSVGREHLLAVAICGLIIAATFLFTSMLRSMDEFATNGPFGPRHTDQELQRINQTCVDSARYQGLDPGSDAFTRDVADCERSAKASSPD